MTRNDILNKADAETKIKLIFEKWHFCCRQEMGKTREERERIWKALCLNKFRLGPDGDGLNCTACKAEFLAQEIEKEKPREEQMTIYDF